MELDQNSLRACSRAAQATRAIRLRRARLKYAVLCLAALCVCLCLMTVGVFAARAAEVQTAQDQNSGSQVEQRGEQKNTPPPAGDTATPAPSAANTPVEVRELWTGSLYSSTYRVGVCVSAQGTVRGVVHLRLYNGKVDVYHIDGTVRNNDIEAHHSSGHSFKGRLASADKVEGVISLKNGMNVRLEGKRIHDAPLAPEDCAPLPQ
jgi:hypothetical protein